MNPEQPSREQIEARLTALLLGELPAAEAELLRWTISKDPELQKLHDQLSATIGFVREAMRNPTGAPVDRETPLKLAQERRKTLLAHFKTARPQPAQPKSFWLRQLYIPSKRSLAIAAIVVLVIGGLAAMLLPNGGRRERGSLVESYNSYGTLETAISGKRAARERITSQQTASINKMRQLTEAEGEWKLETGKAGQSAPGVSGPDRSARRNNGELAPIALPKTESTQTGSDEYAGVFSQNVVGVSPVAVGSTQNAANPAPKTETTFAISPSSSYAALQPGAQNASPLASRLPGVPSRTGTQSFGGAGGVGMPPYQMAVPPSQPVVLAPPPQISMEPKMKSETASSAPVAGGIASSEPANAASWSLLSDRERAVDVKRAFEKSVSATNYIAMNDDSSDYYRTRANSGGLHNGPVGSAPVPSSATVGTTSDELNGAWSANDLHLKVGNIGLAGRSSLELQNALDHATNGTPWAAQYFNFPDAPSSGYGPSSDNITSYIAMNQVLDGDRNIGVAPTPVAAPPDLAKTPTLGPLPAREADIARVGLPPRSQQEYQYQLFASNEAVGTPRGQAYPESKNRLDDEIALHKLLGEKIQADKADASTSKNAMVAVINPAAPGQSQNFWQRMTGQVESKAQIEIQPDITSDAPAAYASYDPYFLETELNTIRGDVVLGKVVDSLKLDQAWSNQNYGEKLSRKDAIALLRSRLDLEADRNTKLIDIGAKSDKPDEAADIANAVAEAYKQYRLETRSNEMAAGIEALQRKYAQEDREIRGLQAQLAEKKVMLAESQGLRHPDVPKSVHQADMPLTPPPANAPIPQPEILTTDNAFSTFSLNVSDVSFKLAMASLQKGQLPSPASIRSEEFINAFDYHDPEPLQGEPLAFACERAIDPFAHERDLLRFSIKAAAAGRQDGRALNLVLLLDTSGSMERADRVAIIRQALTVLAAQLQPNDVVSVVTFARTARLWADGVPGNQAGATLDKVGSITPEGGTNLEEAMRLAYETALRHFIAGGMNRVVLMTDGAANLGNVDPKALAQRVDTERRQGIALDCFGIGWDDYNDDLLEQLSSNGDGRYAFINSPDEAATEFAAKLAGALQVAAEDVKVQVEFNPNRVTVWRQIGYAKHQLTRQQFRDNSVAAGAIAAREAGNALYDIEPKADGEGPIATVRVRYRVPGTRDVRERSWLVEYTGDAPELAQSSPAMRLAVCAADISEWMADSPFAQDVTPDELLNYLSGVPQTYGTDERPKQLEWMIRQAGALNR